jgi:hypothetical protein
MKKILILPALLIAVSGFGQTFKTSQVVDSDKIVSLKKEPHTITLKDSIVTLDDKVYNLSIIAKTTGSTRSITLGDYKGILFTFSYNKKKIVQIQFIKTINKVVIHTIYRKIKEIK